MAKKKGKGKSKDSTPGKGKKGKKEKKELSARDIVMEKKKQAAAEAEAAKLEAIENAKRTKILSQENQQRLVKLVETGELFRNFEKIVYATSLSEAHMKEWEHYLACRKVPNVSSLIDVNACMTEWITELGTNPHMKDILLHTSEILELITDLKEFLMLPTDNVKKDNLDELGLMYHEFKERQQSFIDDSSYTIMQDLEEYYDPEEGIFEDIVRSEDKEIVHALWGNLFACPENDRHEYSGMGFKFRIPEQLVHTKAIYRLLKTDYDHYSDNCLSYFGVGVENALKKSILSWIAKKREGMEQYLELKSPEDPTKQKKRRRSKSKKKKGKKKRKKKGKKRKGKKSGADETEEEESDEDWDDEDKKPKKSKKKKRKGQMEGEEDGEGFEEEIPTKKKKGKKGKKKKGKSKDETEWDGEGEYEDDLGFSARKTKKGKKGKKKGKKDKKKSKNTEEPTTDEPDDELMTSEWEETGEDEVSETVEEENEELLGEQIEEEEEEEEVKLTKSQELRQRLLGMMEKDKEETEGDTGTETGTGKAGKKKKKGKSKGKGKGKKKKGKSKKKKGKKKGKKSKSKGKKKGKKKGGKKSKGGKSKSKSRGKSSGSETGDESDAEAGGVGKKKGKKGKKGKGKSKSESRGRSRTKKEKKGGKSKSKDKSKSKSKSGSKGKSKGKKSKSRGRSKDKRSKSKKSGKGSKKRSKSKRKGKKGKKSKSKSKDKKTKNEAKLAKEREKAEKDAFIPTLHANELNLRQFGVQGGVYNFRMVEVPAQPHERGEWTLHRIEHDQWMKDIPYEGEEVIMPEVPNVDDVLNPPPPPVDPATADKPKDAELSIDIAMPTFVGLPPVEESPEEIEEKRKKLEAELMEKFEQDKETALNKLLNITIQLPKNSLWFTEPFPVIWDSEDLLWSTEGFHGVKYNPETLELDFRASKFGVIGLATPKYSNLPLKSWELVSNEMNKATLTIQAAKVKLVISFMDDLAALTELTVEAPNIETVHEAVLNKYMKPGDLMKTLKSIGVDIFPDFDSYAYIPDLLVKQEDIESHLYECMAIVATSYNMAWSQWNHRVPRDNFVFQLSDKISGKPRLVFQNFRQCTYLKCEETSASYSEEPAEGVEYSPDLVQLVQQQNFGDSIEINELLKKVNPLFIASIRMLLLNIRPFSYTWEEIPKEKKKDKKKGKNLSQDLNQSPNQNLNQSLRVRERKRNEGKRLNY